MICVINLNMKKLLFFVFEISKNLSTVFIARHACRRADVSEVPKVLLLVYVRASELRAIFRGSPALKIT